MLDILSDHICRDILVKLLINFHDSWQIFPTTRRCKLFAVNRCFHLIETVISKFQIRKNCRMNIFFECIFFPDTIIRFYCDLLDTIQCNNIKITDGFVVFRWITCCYDHPAFWNFMISKSFALQKLQHRRSQCLWNTVNLIDKQNSFSKSGFSHTVINARHNLTHRVLCRWIFPASIFFLRDKWKTDRTLSGVMCDRISDQCHTTLSSCLFHDLCLSDSRCSQKKYRSLMYPWYHIFIILVFQKIRLYSIYDFLFCLFNIHNALLSSLFPVPWYPVSTWSPMAAHPHPDNHLS